MRRKTCRVLYAPVGGPVAHLANVWLFDDGRWSLEPTEVAVPLELVHITHLFEAFTGMHPPPLVSFRLPNPRRGDYQEFLRRHGVTDDDKIGQLVAYGGSITDRIRFVP